MNSKYGCLQFWSERLGLSDKVVSKKERLFCIVTGNTFAGFKIDRDEIVDADLQERARYYANHCKPWFRLNMHECLEVRECDVTVEESIEKMRLRKKKNSPLSFEIHMYITPPDKKNMYKPGKAEKLVFYTENTGEAGGVRSWTKHLRIAQWYSASPLNIQQHQEQHDDDDASTTCLKILFSNNLHPDIHTKPNHILSHQTKSPRALVVSVTKAAENEYSFEDLLCHINETLGIPIHSTRLQISKTSHGTKHIVTQRQYSNPILDHLEQIFDNPATIGAAGSIHVHTINLEAKPSFVIPTEGFVGRFEKTLDSWVGCAKERLNGRYGTLKLVLLHPPKTGGSVVENALMINRDVRVTSPQVGPCHAPLTLFDQDGEVQERSFSFLATVRHPYSRLVSSFFYRAAEGTPAASHLVRLGLRSFVLDELLHRFRNGTFYESDIVFWPQTLWLTTAASKKPSNREIKIIRQEFLENDFKRWREWYFVNLNEDACREEQQIVIPLPGRFNVNAHPTLKSLNLDTDSEFLNAVDEIYSDDLKLLQHLY